MSGLIIAAPSSSSGKTTVTLALLRALSRRGQAISPIKIGPDYIDPGFHAAACGADCWNLDAWALGPAAYVDVIRRSETRGTLVVAEGVMGLFDGATLDEGATADVAASTGWPVILVVDASGMAASIAALVHGFATYRPDVRIGGVIANKIGSSRHRAILAEALERIDIPLLGALPRDPELALPSRHLGLVLAGEREGLEKFLDTAANALESHVDVNALRQIAAPSRDQVSARAITIAPIGQRIAIARDEAFAFVYARTMTIWQEQGAELMMFSPLLDEAPDPQADAVYLPGGYPELHAGRLAANQRFMRGVRAAAARQAFVFGECGGYMALGRALTDADGVTHEMANLLPVHTSFAERGLTLGYRRATLLRDTPLGRVSDVWRGHEFHFSKVVSEDSDDRLFAAEDARGNMLGSQGLVRQSVAGSYLHLIDRER